MVPERLANFLTYLEEMIGRYEDRAKRMDDDSARRERLESKSAVVPGDIARVSNGSTIAS